MVIHGRHSDVGLAFGRDQGHFIGQMVEDIVNLKFSISWHRLVEGVDEGTRAHWHGQLDGIFQLLEMPGI